MGIKSDNPINKPEEDALGRNSAAKAFASQVKALDASEGLVVGVLGPWGSGKTSFVNLVRNDLDKDDYVVLDFNPWMFSGANQLVDAFFIELSAQLKLRDSRLQKIGENFEEYGDVLSGLAWVPVVGTWIERFRLLGKGAAKVLKKNKQGTGEVRKRLTAALREVDRPILVVIDDIDRLTTLEIRDIFKLVRLTASFPNIIYVLAFDRKRVEDALTEQGVPGRDYLEKILQLAIDLPVVPPTILNQQIFSSVAEVLEGVKNPGPFDKDTWPDIYYETIRPLVKNMRDVRRFGIAIRGTVESLNGQVALQDVLSIEAIRVFLPDVFAEISGAVEGLTAQSSGYSAREEPPRLKAAVDKVVDAAGPRKDLVEDFIGHIFPAAARHIGGTNYGHSYSQQWLKDRRLASESVLRFYLERQSNDKFSAFTDAERAFSLLDKQYELDKFLRSLNPDRLEDVISALENYENDFPNEGIVPGLIVLLNLLPDLPKKEKHDMFALDSRLVVGRVIYRLLKRLSPGERTMTAVNEVLPNLTTMSSKFELLTDIGYREGAGHKLVSEHDAAALEKALRDEIRAASVTKLSKEYELVRLLLAINKESTPDEPSIDIPSNYKLTHAIIKGVQSEMRSQSWGSRAVKTTPVLAWDVLVGLFGSENELMRRANLAKKHYPQEKSLYDLVDKYASGWRPNRDDD